MIEQKSISTIDKFLGQFMTPENITQDIVNNLDIDKSSNTIWIEPSFGTGNFIKSLISYGCEPTQIMGVEIDSNLYNQFDLQIRSAQNMNFYDFFHKFKSNVHFIGNVPFRTPALSLTTHKSEIQRLTKKYKVSGIREEAVFFILKTLEIIEESDNGGRMSYIVPKSLMTNNSKFFKTFHKLLDDKFKFLKIVDLPSNIFEGAALETCLIDFEYNPGSDIKHDKTVVEYWDYNKIFKRTYLGSVPCESIFLSVEDETKDDFKQRLQNLFSQFPKNTEDNLKSNGKFHLKVLNGDNQDLRTKKIKVIESYIQECLSKLGEDFLTALSNDDNYKKINHRHKTRFYFRYTPLKRCSFVYEINPNPQKSFYFTGNPSSSSTDYFGYCDFDITRNSSPGACRTIPIVGLEDNLTDEFKLWWDVNIKREYTHIFDLFLKTHKSNWYKKMKKQLHRFYFGIPKDISLLG